MENGSFKDGFLTDLKSKCDIVSEIGKYVELKRKGNTFWGRCPFHFEKTPSFSVDNMKGFYHCFGCGASGDVIKFVEKMESTDFLGAVEILANHAGMEIRYSHGDMQEIAKRAKEKKEILKALDDAKEFYIQQLYLSSSQVAQNYIKERKLTKYALDNFFIGYSPDFYSMPKALQLLGNSKEIMEKAGLINIIDGKMNDAYGKRLMFPIIDTMNNVIGFSGRILEKNDNLAKYKNTRQTLVFDKSKVVYGLRQAIVTKNEKQFDNLIIVEGQIDVITLHQNGFTNAVASQGTALTEQHILALKKVVDKIYLCYDGDSAGRKATLRALELLKNSNLEVKVVALPLGFDPDLFMKQKGSEEFKQALTLAEGSIDYQLRILAENVNMNLNFDKTKYITNCFKILQELPTTAEAEIYLTTIRDKTDVPLDILRESLGKISNKSVEIHEHLENKQNVKIENKYYKSEKIVLATLLVNSNKINEINFNEIDFDEPLFKKVFDFLKERNGQVKTSELFDKFDIDENPNLIEIIDFPFSNDENVNERLFNESLITNEIKSLEKLDIQLNDSIKQLESITERKIIYLKINENQIKLREKKEKLKNLQLQTNE